MSLFRIEEPSRLQEQAGFASLCLAMDFCLIVEPEEGGTKFLRDVSEFLPDYTALNPRK
jgi:hypothetical protein